MCGRTFLTRSPDRPSPVTFRNLSLAPSLQLPAPRRPNSAPCPNGTCPISIPAWTARRSGAISPGPRPSARRSPRPIAASSMRWRGASGASETLGEAVKRYEAVEDLLGRLMSYAGLVYSGDTTDPMRAKFYGDTQERLTAASSELLFFGLELNRIEDAVLDRAMAQEPLAHYRPWIEDLRKDKPYPARRQDRAALPREVGDRPLRLEPPVRRDHRVPALHRARRGAAHRADPQQAAGPGRERAQGRLRRARQDLQGEPAHLHAHHQHARQGQGDLRPLARLRGRGRFPPSREPGRARGGGGAGLRRARGLSAPVAPLLRPEGASGSARTSSTIGTATRRCRRSSSAPSPGTRRRDTVLSAYSAFSPRMADIAQRFFDEDWIDAPTRPGKAPGAFAHPTVPSAHPYVLLNYQGKPRDVMTLAHELGHGVHQVLAGAQRRAHGADAPDARRDGERLRRDAHLPPPARPDHRSGAAQGDAGGQGRGHDQHGGAPDRVLFLRAQGACGAPQRRTDGRQAVRALDVGAGRVPRPGDPSRAQATRASGPTSRTSSTRRSTSTPMPSAIAW